MMAGADGLNVKNTGCDREQGFCAVEVTGAKDATFEFNGVTCEFHERAYPQNEMDEGMVMPVDFEGRWSPTLPDPRHRQAGATVSPMRYEAWYRCGSARFLAAGRGRPLFPVGGPSQGTFAVKHGPATIQLAAAATPHKRGDYAAWRTALQNRVINDLAPQIPDGGGKREAILASLREALGFQKHVIEMDARARIDGQVRFLNGFPSWVAEALKIEAPEKQAIELIAIIRAMVG